MIDLSKIIHVKSTEIIHSGVSFDEYRQCLEGFWQQSYSECINLVSDLLVQKENHEYSLALYRLWIECLCELKEYDSLVELKNHILKRGLHSENSFRSFAALRALIHLELDEWDACVLLRETMDESFTCPYTLEFLQLYNQRITPDEQGVLVSLEKSENVLVDYFHWNHLATGMLLKSQEKSLMHVLNNAEKIFPSSPLTDLFMTHLFVDESLWSDALVHSTKLKNKFSKNFEFQFAHAYIQRKNGDLKGAIKSFQQLFELRNTDLDVLAELANCYGERSEGDQYSPHWENALHYYELAIGAYKKSGLPTTELEFKKEQLQKNVSESDHLNVQERDRKFWLGQLNALNYNELLSDDEDQLKKIFISMGGKAKRGDLVFYTTKNHIGLNKKSMRLVAIYEVDMDVSWHPLVHQETVLKLVKKIDFPIILDFGVNNESDRRKKARLNDPIQYGFYELDQNAFAYIENEIEACVHDFSEEQNFLTLYKKSS